jgi:hypothetical protein
LLNGVVPIIGGSPGDLLTDLELLYGTVTDGRPSAPAFVVSGRAAAYLAVHGGQIFRDVKARGVGMILGAPQYVCPAAANRLILIDSSEVAVADGGLEVDESGQVAVQMTDNPSGGASLVSAFQTGTRVARFIRSLTWAKLRDDAAGYVELGVLAGSPA